MVWETFIIKSLELNIRCETPEQAEVFWESLSLLKKLKLSNSDHIAQLYTLLNTPKWEIHAIEEIIRYIRYNLDNEIYVKSLVENSPLIGEKTMFWIRSSYWGILHHRSQRTLLLDILSQKDSTDRKKIVDILRGIGSDGGLEEADIAEMKSTVEMFLAELEKRCSI